jgi:HK97 family phage prohead protease
VAAAKRYCSTGKLTEPGMAKKFNPGDRAQACAAVAEWERMRAATQGESRALAPLPDYMERIRAHLIAERGMSPDKATATAIATCHKFCQSGESPNLPVHVNAGSRAEACAAVRELQLARKPQPTPEPPGRPAVAEKVTDAAWDGSPSRFTDEQYARSCVLDRGPSVTVVKDRYSLPVREPDGTLNRNAVHSAAGRIAAVVAAALVIKAAAKTIVGLYKTIGETPPDAVVKLAGAATAAAGTATAGTGAAAAAAAKKQKQPSEQRDLDEKIETRSAPDPLVLEEGKRVRGRIPFNTESRTLPGGFREVIKPGAFANADLSHLVATVEHGGVPLARYPQTLQVETKPDGLHWSLTLPESRADVREALERGDLNASSWSMVVGADKWAGATRFVHEVRSLRDVSLVVTGAYPKEAAFAELRAHEIEEEENPVEVEEQHEHVEDVPEETEVVEARSGSLRVTDRNEGGEVERRDLLGMFQQAGWTPGTRVEIPFSEYEGCVEHRSMTWTGTLDTLNLITRTGLPLGADTRWVWPSVPRDAVDQGVTAVQIAKQQSRTLPAAADVVRPLAAVTDKPEVDSAMDVETVSLQQVAAIQSAVPNIFLLQDQLRSIIGVDLRLAINEGLDAIVLAGLATAPHHDPTTDPLLVSIRKAITIIEGHGYNPDTVVLTPAESESLDLLTTSGPEKFYVWSAAKMAPGTLFNLNVRIAKNATEPIVFDSSAVGRLYASPVALATFEENFGRTNSSTVRLEGTAVFGPERIDAACRIAAS